MFAGHVGVALALGRAERRINVGVLVAAALLLDILLWLFVLLGLESVTTPADFASAHQPEFVFPWSHGLLASLGWSLLAGVMGLVVWRQPTQGRLRVGVVLAAAVFSHWLLDWLVHAPELPVLGALSPKLGLGLWNHMPLALALEAGIVLAGVVLFVPACQLSATRKVSMALLCLLLLVFTVVGMTIAPAPPSALAMAATSLVTLVMVCALFCWLGKRRDQAGTAPG